MFVDSPTEQTAAVKDVVLALQCLAAIVMLKRAMQVTMISTFDNHGVFHFSIMLSLLLITIGTQMSHRSFSVLNV